MPSAISVTSVIALSSSGGSISERKRVCEHAGAGTAAAERAHELDGVDLDVLSVDTLAERAAGGTVEHEVERLAVDGGPLADEIGDEAAVVFGSGVHGTASGGTQIDPV